MYAKYNQLLIELTDQLNFIDLEIDDTLIHCEKAIEITTKLVKKLKILFINDNFTTEEQEIEFFKNIKPKFTFKLIYYNIIYKIEVRMPYGGERVVKKYLNNQLEKIKNYFYDNNESNKYHRTRSVYLDNRRIKTICIYPKDIERITGKSYRQSTRMLQAIRKSLNKLDYELVTIDVFCQYAGLKIEQVEPLIFV